MDGISTTSKMLALLKQYAYLIQAIGRGATTLAPAVKAFGDALRLQNLLIQKMKYPTGGITNSKHKPRQVRVRGRK